MLFCNVFQAVTQVSPLRAPQPFNNRRWLRRLLYDCWEKKNLLTISCVVQIVDTLHVTGKQAAPRPSMGWCNGLCQSVGATF